MTGHICLAMVVTCLCSGAFAESFIVTKEGKGFWTSSVRKDEKAIHYTDKATGQERTLPLAAVEGMVPSVQKGVDYKQEQIKSNLDNIRALLAKHMSLTRDLNTLRQDWLAVQKGDPGLGKQIEIIAEKFNAGDMGIRAYKSAAMDLGMCKYKDVQGKYTGIIDELTGEVKKRFLAGGFARLEAMANTNRISVSDFREVKNLAGALADAGQKEKADGLVESIRGLALSLNSKEALGRFSSSKTVDAYLESADILACMKNEIASAADEKTKIEALMKGLLLDVSKAQPAFSFDFKGFPMTKNDSAALSSMQQFASRVTFTSSDLDEQCFVFPLQQPAKILLNKPFSVSLRLVFNRAQPKDRAFGIMVLIPGAQRMDSHTVALGGLQVRNGGPGIRKVHQNA